MSSAKFFIVLITLATVTAIFGVLSSHQTVVVEKSPEEIYLMASDAVVSIRMNFSYSELNKETGKEQIYYNQGIFTGTIVTYSGYSEPFIISAGHLFVNLKNVTWKDCSFTAFFKNPQSPEKIILCGIDEPYLKGGLDCSVFKFKDSKIAHNFRKKALRLGSSANLKTGEKIFVMGHFIDIPFVFSQGYITYLNLCNFYSYRPQTIMTDAIFSFGSSGGPLLNKMGELVGINVEITPNDPGRGAARMYLSVPIDDIKKVLVFFANYNPNAVTSGPIFIRHPIPQQIVCANSWEQFDEELSIMGLTQRPLIEGIIVIGFQFPFLPAAKIIHSGDFIISCNSNVVKNKNDFYRAIFFSFNKKAEIVLVRDGKLMNVIVDLVTYEEL